MVKSTDCSSKGPDFKSLQPCGGSEASVMRSGGGRDLVSHPRKFTPRNVIWTINRTTIYDLPMHASALPGINLIVFINNQYVVTEEIHYSH